MLYNKAFVTINKTIIFLKVINTQKNLLSQLLSQRDATQHNTIKRAHGGRWDCLFASL